MTTGAERDRMAAIDAAITGFGDILQDNPGIFSPVQGGQAHQDRLLDTVNNLYVPNLRIDGRVVQAIVPAAYADSDHIPAIGFVQGDLLAPPDLFGQSPSQISQTMEVLNAYEQQTSVDASEAYRRLALQLGKAAATDRESFGITLGGIGHAECNSNQPDLAALPELTKLQAKMIGRHVLALRVDRPQPAGIMGHEVSHLTRMRNIGLIPVDPIFNLHLFTAEELQAFQDESAIDRTIRLLGGNYLDSSADSRAIVRTHLRFTRGQPPYAMNERLFDSLQKDGLLHMVSDETTITAADVIDLRERYMTGYTLPDHFVTEYEAFQPRPVDYPQKISA